MVTSDQLKTIMPHLSAAKAEVCLPCLVEAMKEFAIESPLRMAALRLVGQLHCHKRAPMCAGCPLVRQCATAQDSELSDRLF